MNMTDELHKLRDLHESGAISDEEFAQAKAKLLAGASPAGGVGGGGAGGGGVPSLEQQTRQWALFVHLAQFAGYLVPLAGLILPIVLWQMKKVDLPGIDEHGKVVVNWIISQIIYLVVCVLLIFVVIGIPLLIVLGIIGIIFPIIGAIKADRGEVWRYPLSIRFFR